MKTSFDTHEGRILATVVGRESHYDVCQLTHAKSFYRSEGYVAVKQVVHADLCDRIVQDFQQRAKPFLQDHPEMFAESNRRFADDGLLQVAIALTNGHFPALSDGVSEAAHGYKLSRIVGELMECKFGIIRMSYSETRKGSEHHADIDNYRDTPRPEKIVTCWMALEDINSESDRLFLYAQSHRGQHPPLHEQYFRQMYEFARNYDCVIPALNKGDAIFMNSNIVHGSVIPAASVSRNSAIVVFSPAEQNS